MNKEAQFLADSSPFDALAAEQGAAPPFRLYTDTADTPLRILRRCMREDTWEYLIIDGAPPAALVQAAGLSIYSEYCQAVGGIQMQAMMSNTSRKEALRQKIDRVQRALAVSKAVYVPETADLFRKDYPAEAKKLAAAEDDETYQKVLMRIGSLLKSDEMTLQRMEVEFPKTAKRNPEEADKEIDQVLVAIEEMMRREIDDDISVRKYCIYVERLRERDKPKPAAKANGARRHG